MPFQITVNLIPGLPKEAYDAGHYIGVVGHATANYANGNDTADGERGYESTHWSDAFVHFFVDDTKIEQTADITYLCYGAGHTANHSGYVQVELCQFSGRCDRTIQSDGGGQRSAKCSRFIIYEG